MSHQTFFVWPHGGKSVSLAGTFNHWNPHPLHKQGNYFFGVLDLPDGVYSYKFVVDGRWVYDISQIHVDDGSGNWNNEIEVGKAAVVHKEPSSQQHQHHQHQHQHQHQEQPQHQHKEQPQHQHKEQPQHQHKEQPQKQGGEKQPQQKSKKQLKKEQQQAERQQKGGDQQQRGKQQQKKNEPQPEPEPEAQKPEEVEQVAEPVPEPEAEAVAEAETEAAVEEEPQAEAEVEAEVADTPQAEQKPEKVLISILTIEVVGQSDVDMVEVEKFVRSVERPGLKWEGSAVKPHVFGLYKLEIICQSRDDVAIEDDVLVALAKNEDLVASAQIIGFAC